MPISICPVDCTCVDCELDTEASSHVQVVQVVHHVEVPRVEQGKESKKKRRNYKKLLLAADLTLTARAVKAENLQKQLRQQLIDRAREAADLQRTIQQLSVNLAMSEANNKSLMTIMQLEQRLASS